MNVKENSFLAKIKFKWNGHFFDKFIIISIIATKYEGNVIGLSLVKRIVENHNGTIHAISEKDKGAKFHVILPVSQTP